MGGAFTTIGTVASTGQSPIAAAIAYLDSTTSTWKAVATNANGPIHDLAVSPTTGRLWAVGGMTLLSPTLTGTGGVTYFDENLSSWVYAGGLPTQLTLASASFPLKAIAFDSSGNAIVGGHPSVSAGTNVLHGLARLNPTTKSWETLGGGICGGLVEDLAVWGDKLFVGGNFTKVSDTSRDCGPAAIEAPGFAVYDLSTGIWSNFGANLTDGDTIFAFQMTDFSARNETAHLSDYLLVAGKFSEFAGNTDLVNLAKWDGTTWLAATSVEAPVGNGTIFAVHTDGYNTYIGGEFSTGNVTNVAAWDGTRWLGMNNGLFCLNSICDNATVNTISAMYTLESAVVTPLSWGGFDLSNYINWKWWLICLCAVLIAALILALLTNCCWKVVGCCRSNCINSKPREKLPGL